MKAIPYKFWINIYWAGRGVPGDGPGVLVSHLKLDKEDAYKDAKEAEINGFTYIHTRYLLYQQVYKFSIPHFHRNIMRSTALK